jgi:hypothetical protein
MVGIVPFAVYLAANYLTGREFITVTPSYNIQNEEIADRHPSIVNDVFSSSLLNSVLTLAPPF